MALPGSQGYPPPKTETEGIHQIIQLLFQLNATLTNLRVEMHNINGNLQTISAKTGR